MSCVSFQTSVIITDVSIYLHIKRHANQYVPTNSQTTANEHILKRNDMLVTIILHAV